MKYILSALLILSFIHKNAHADDLKPNKKDILASASTWDNLRNNENSLKFIISKLIKSATKGRDKGSFILFSRPNKVLTDYSDQQYCLDKKSKTTSSKLEFSSPTLEGDDALNAWIGDFSQGKGEAGNKLYDLCDKSCSPSYEYRIDFSSSTKKDKDGSLSYGVKALVICGEARDKDDNQYILNIL